MPPAIVTPSELVAFARHLTKTAQSVARRKSKATRLVADSRSVWKDAKYDSFQKTFDQTTKELDRFVRLAEDYAQFLERKAGRARKYLHNR
ncbi:MAG: WXG100 family type VII secretion target [Vicinamibacterales bacterium]